MQRTVETKRRRLSGSFSGYLDDRSALSALGCDIATPRGSSFCLNQYTPAYLSNKISHELASELVLDLNSTWSRDCAVRRHERSRTVDATDSVRMRSSSSEGRVTSHVTLRYELRSAVPSVFDLLTDDVLVHIFRMLGDSLICCLPSLELTCKRFRRCLADHRLWLNVDLTGLGMTAIDDEALASVVGRGTEMRSLSVSSASLTAEGLRPLFGVRQSLQVLDLRFCMGLSAGALMLISHLRTLRRLNLKGCTRIRRSVPDSRESLHMAFDQLAKLTRLESLNLRRVCIDDEVLARVCLNLTRLEELCVSLNRAHDATRLSPALIASLSRLTRLRKLTLDDEKTRFTVSGDDMMPLAALTHLEKLNVSGIKHAKSALTYLGSLTRLTSLRFMVDRIEDHDFSFLRNLTRLKRLSVQDVEMSAGADVSSFRRHFGALAALTDLKLDICPDIVLKLEALGVLTQLERLDLSYVSSPDVIARLAQCPRLVSLDLHMAAPPRLDCFAGLTHLKDLSVIMHGCKRTDHEFLSCLLPQTEVIIEEGEKPWIF